MAAPQLYTHSVYANEGMGALLDQIDASAELVLDIGCGAGDNARQLSSRGMRVHGITLSQKEAECAAPHLEKVILADVEEWAPEYPPATFDALVMSHVLEHLADPRAVLERLKPLLKTDGKLYVAVPNIVFWRERLQVLKGLFQYEDRGARDYSHLRFFTYYSAQELVRDSGFQIVGAQALGHFPLGKVRRLLPRWGKIWDEWCCRSFPNFFGYQTLIVAAPHSR